MRTMICGMILALLTFHCCGCNDASKPQAKSLSAQFEDAMKKTDADARARALVVVAFAQQKEGDSLGVAKSLDAARIAAKEMPEGYDRAKIMVQLAGMYGHLKQVKDADSLLSEVNKSADKVEEAVNKLELNVKAAQVKGQYLNEADTAQTQLQAAEKTAESFADPKDKISSTLLIALAYHTVNSKENCDRLIAAASELTKNCDDKRKQTDGYVQLAETLEKVDRVDEAITAFSEALKTASAIDDPLSRAHTFRTLAEKLARLGKKDEARTLLAQADKAAAKVTDNAMKQQILEQLDKLRARL